MQQNPDLTRIDETVFGEVNGSHDDPVSSLQFEWSDLLDLNVDEDVAFLFPEHQSQEQPGFDHNEKPENSGRVRKRDPRLVCPNFLAGRVPCACPELDEKLEERRDEEEELGGVLPQKKRSRNAIFTGVGGGGSAWCQVPGCDVDISELKGYHKRHRVCLDCANASAVVLDGDSRRYCQQCGKFHLLSDFDENKRSCRRKLEWHNYRRRRKSNNSKGRVEKKLQQESLVDDASGDEDIEKEDNCLSGQTEEKETVLEPDQHASLQQLQNDSVASFSSLSETVVEVDKQKPKFKRQPLSYPDNKSKFYSMCPTGRISFKLYDWNPAEFPRRLRHQIFEWLASMPVELEGYIRPGCTILTAFIAVRSSMWLKLLEEPTQCIKDFVGSPGSLLAGRSTMLVYLNDMIFRVTKDATSVVKVDVQNQAPKLHYIYPTCFEAGRPLEFVVCGSNLLQPKFRFLVSFSGKYFQCNICVSSMSYEKGNKKSFSHQLVKILVPQTEQGVFGPAFVEVENQSGLSNFIPILIGNKETCAELEIFRLKFKKLPPSRQLATHGSDCEVSAARDVHFSDFVLEVSWLLKMPVLGQKLTTFHIQRFNYLLNFLVEEDSTVVLGRVYSHVKALVNDNLVVGVSDDDVRLLWKNMDMAREKLVLASVNGGRQAGSHVTKQMVEESLSTNSYRVEKFPASQGETAHLLHREVVMYLNLQERPRTSSGKLLTRAFWTSRPFIMAFTMLGLCFGVYAVSSTIKVSVQLQQLFEGVCLITIRCTYLRIHFTAPFSKLVCQI